MRFALAISSLDRAWTWLAPSRAAARSARSSDVGGVGLAAGVHERVGPLGQRDDVRDAALACHPRLQGGALPEQSRRAVLLPQSSVHLREDRQHPQLGLRLILQGAFDACRAVVQQFLGRALPRPDGIGLPRAAGREQQAQELLHGLGRARRDTRDARLLIRPARLPECGGQAHQERADHERRCTGPHGQCERRGGEDGQPHGPAMPPRQPAQPVGDAVATRVHAEAFEVACPVLGQRGHRGVAIGGLLLQRPVEHRIEVAAQFARDGPALRHPAGERDLLRGDRIFQRCGAGPPELVGPGARQKLVGHDAEAVHVARRADSLSPDLLGAGVVGREDAPRRLRQCSMRLRVVLDQLGDSEVEQPDLALLRDQDVRGLEVAVNHRAGMGERHGVGHLEQQPKAARQARHVLAAMLVDRQALDVLQCQERLAVRGDTGVVETGDARVLQRREDVPLARETLRKGTAGLADRRQLERNLAIQLPVGPLGPPDLAHAARTEPAEQAIRADGVARGAAGSIDRGLGARKGREIGAAVEQVGGLAPDGPASRRRSVGASGIASSGRRSSHARRSSSGRSSAWSSQRDSVCSSDGLIMMQVRAALPQPAIGSRASLHGGRQQQARLLPVAAHRAFRDAERLGDLGLGHAAEEPHLDHLRQPRIRLRQRVQRFVHAQHVVLGSRQPLAEPGVDGYVLRVAPAALGLPGARQVDDDRSHDLRCIGEEVPSILERQRAVVEETEVGLVHQRRGVEQRHRPVRPQPRAGQPAQVRVEQ